MQNQQGKLWIFPSIKNVTDGLCFIATKSYFYFQIAEPKNVLGFPSHIEKLRQVKDVIADINEILNNLENQIKEIVNDIGTDLKRLDGTVKQVLQNLDLDKFVQDMKEKIDDILKKAQIEAATVQKCIDTEEQSVAELVDRTSVKIKECISPVDDTTRAIKDRAVEIKDKAAALLKNLKDGLENCLQSGNQDCVNDVFESAKNQVSDMNILVEDFVINTNDILLQLAFDFKKCMVAVEMEVWDYKRDIIADFKECIATKNYFM